MARSRARNFGGGGGTSIGDILRAYFSAQVESNPDFAIAEDVKANPSVMDGTVGPMTPDQYNSIQTKGSKPFKAKNFLAKPAAAEANVDYSMNRLLAQAGVGDQLRLQKESMPTEIQKAEKLAEIARRNAVLQEQELNPIKLNQFQGESDITTRAEQLRNANSTDEELRYGRESMPTELEKARRLAEIQRQNELATKEGMIPLALREEEGLSAIKTKSQAHQGYNTFLSGSGIDPMDNSLRESFRSNVSPEIITRMLAENVAGQNKATKEGTKDRIDTDILTENEITTKATERNQAQAAELGSKFNLDNLPELNKLMMQQRRTQPDIEAAKVMGEQYKTVSPGSSLVDISTKSPVYTSPIQDRDAGLKAILGGGNKTVTPQPSSSQAPKPQGKYIFNPKTGQLINVLTGEVVNKQQPVAP